MRMLSAQLTIILKELNIFNECKLVPLILEYASIDNIHTNYPDKLSWGFLINVENPRDQKQQFIDCAVAVTRAMQNNSRVFHRLTYYILEVTTPGYEDYYLTFLLVLRLQVDSYESKSGFIRTLSETAGDIALKLAQTEITFKCKSLVINAVTKSYFAKRWIVGCGGGRGWNLKPMLKVIISSVSKNLVPDYPNPVFTQERSSEIEWIQYYWEKLKKQGCSLKNDCNCEHCLFPTDILLID